MTARAHILVIDDEPGIREGCKRALTPQGFDVDTARDGSEGLAKIRSGGFDLALLDVMMPGISGLDLLSLIREHDPDVVCIIITGYATVPLAVNAIKQGAYDFISKPFTVDDLLLTVNQGLERRKLLLETKRLQKIEAEARRLASEKAKLEELEKSKAAFIRLVTHELQSPAAAVQGYLQLILDGYVAPEKTREYVEKAAARAREEVALIGDLLELGRLRELKDRGQIVPVRLDDVLHKALEPLENQARQKGQQLHVEVAPDVPSVRGVANEFKSLWSNLIGNAIKYTPEGGIVTVSLRADGQQVIGQVRDTGIGIPPEARDRLFTEFFRAENAKASSLRGTGLGLVIVKQVVETAGGRIWVESEVGRGSTFTFLLPAAAEAAAAATLAVVEVAAEPRAKLRIIAKSAMPAFIAGLMEQYEVVGPVAKQNTESILSGAERFGRSAVEEPALSLSKGCGHAPQMTAPQAPSTPLLSAQAPSTPLLSAQDACSAPFNRSCYFDFAPITDPRDLRLDYGTTILPPKKYLLPQRETLFTFKDTTPVIARSVLSGTRRGVPGEVEGGAEAISHDARDCFGPNDGPRNDFPTLAPVFDATPRVLFGVHTCDLHAMRLLDAVFATGPRDEHYLRRRAATTTVSLECLAPCDEHAFCKSMNTLSVADGFDLHMVDLGDAYAVEVGTPAGEALLAHQRDARPAAADDVGRLNKALSEKWTRFPYRLDFDAGELPSLMAMSAKSPLWAELGERCLACAACNLVCPTCYCFDVRDALSLDGETGERIRTWDSCQLDEFAAVAAGENFRESRVARQRHRFFRKGKYIPEMQHELGCVGCGRCARACLVKITPVGVWNALHAEHGEQAGDGEARGKR